MPFQRKRLLNKRKTLDEAFTKNSKKNSKTQHRIVGKTASYPLSCLGYYFHRNYANAVLLCLLAECTKWQQR